MVGYEVTSWLEMTTYVRVSPIKLTSEHLDDIFATILTAHAVLYVRAACGPPSTRHLQSKYCTENAMSVILCFIPDDGETFKRFGRHTWSQEFSEVKIS